MVNPVSMSGKICLITGATSGIGLVSATNLAQMGATVVVVGRNLEKTKNVAARITQETGNQNVDYLIGDFSEMQQVRDIATAFIEKYPRLDILMNNAGSVFGERQVNSDGFELTVATAHYSSFLLTHLLLDSLRASPSSRVVNVASGVQKFVKINIDDFHSEEKFSTGQAYGNAKVAMIMCTYEWADRLKDNHITVNTLHPGVIKSNFGQGIKQPFLLRLIDAILNKKLTVDEGSRTQMYLATSPEVEGITGQYYDEYQVNRKTSKQTYDLTLRRKIWDRTVFELKLNEIS